ncbi:MAG: phosphoenolpyruvate--protein phosphotransferase [Clostridia bacterium]|nr:phosphoenolpyruvate--protein phosphotransferase [Clostridia bacterium]
MSKGSSTYKGVGISSGKVSGKIKFFKREGEAHEEAREIMSLEDELKRLDEAIRRAKIQINQLEKKALATLGEKEAQIFEIHGMLICDEDYVSTIKEEIENGKRCEEAVSKASEIYSNMLLSLDDEYLSARASDIQDISAHLIRILKGEKINKRQKENQPYILVANDLTPSETVQLDGSKILGFVTFGGTPSSHTAILARAMGIPALVGVGAIDESLDGEIGLLNAEKGSIVISPSQREIEEFEKEISAYNKLAKEHDMFLRSIMNKPAVTRSGHKIMIYANIGSEAEVASAISNGAEGIGLLRSEFLYLSKSYCPLEEEIFSAFRDIVIKMQGRRVIIRTLDVGADKQISYLDLPKEENPALGYRGIRVCLEERELFKSQLRAILRASAYGSISIMLPMIVSVDEIRACKAILEECKAELSRKGISYDGKIELGIMIETPASAIMSDTLAKEVDFFSVGTNDLTQYTLAVDRQNPRVAHLCEENLEPILRLIKMSAEAIHKNGGWIGVCGEMAAELSLTEKFAELKIDELSVSVPYLLGVRGKVSECK